MSRCVNLDNSFNIYNNTLQGFLKYPPIVIANLIPDKDGNYEVKNVHFNNYQIVHIAVSDQQQQLTLRKFNVSDAQPIEKKDLRLLDPLDSNKFYNEVRNSFTLNVGQDPLVINDISST